MGLTERHWFENEEPKLTERQLEDIVYENKRAYDSGYVKGYSVRDKEIVRCKDCKHSIKSSDSYVFCNKGVKFDEYKKPDWFCADGERKTDDG